jgi:hypothetical protein
LWAPKSDAGTLAGRGIRRATAKKYFSFNANVLPNPKIPEVMRLFIPEVGGLRAKVFSPPARGSPEQQERGRPLLPDGYELVAKAMLGC